MALQDCVPFTWPGVITNGLANPSVGSTGSTFSTVGHYAAAIVSAPRDMTVSHVGLKFAAVAGSPTATVTLETVNPANGRPSGTLLGATNNATVTTATLTTTFALHAFAESASVTRGQLFALKVALASGTSFTLSGSTGVSMGMPYFVADTGSVAKGGFSNHNWVLGSSTSVFHKIPRFFPAVSVAANAFNNTNSAKRAVRFQVPFKCRVAGLRLSTSTGTGDFNAQIEDDANNILSSSNTAFDGNNFVEAANGGVPDIFFDTPVILSPGVWYRAVIEPSSATNVNFWTYTLPGADYRSGMPGGTNYFYNTFASGSWAADITDQVPAMDLIIDQLDDGVSVGGGRFLG